MSHRGHEGQMRSRRLLKACSEWSDAPCTYFIYLSSFKSFVTFSYLRALRVISSNPRRHASLSTLGRFHLKMPIQVWNQFFADRFQ